MLPRKWLGGSIGETVGLAPGLSEANAVGLDHYDALIASATSAPAGLGGGYERAKICFT